MKDKFLAAGAVVLAAAAIFLFNSNPGWFSFEAKGAPPAVAYPYEGTLFPPDLRSPEFRWEGAAAKWEVRLTVAGSTRAFSASVRENRWTPPEPVWEEFKRLSGNRAAVFEVAAANAKPDTAPARVGFSISKDPVGAPLFYRAGPPGPGFPEEHQYVDVKWRLAWLSSYEPPVTVMENQPRCFNCHAVSANGRTIGFEFNVDEKDKASYFFMRDPGRSVPVAPEQLFSWNGYRPGEKISPFQGNGSAISPDGRVIMTSGKGLTLLHSNCSDMMQYTYIMRGVLTYRTIDDPKLRVLPGGDDEKFMHAPTSWSPDGKYVYFFGGPLTEQLLKMGEEKAAGTYKEDPRQLGWRELDKMYPFLHNVYRIPFAGGKGGRMEPLRGASGNGMSNYFPRVSPDGRWVAFTRSANGSMLIREDSDLYLVPAAGGKERKLKGNGPKADSWHSWSPNGRWLAFASKSYGTRTDIVLTHIDENGEDSPPVVLTHLRERSGLSLNLPEFFNLKPGQFLEMLPRTSEFGRPKP